jgi:uncharacterized protein (TIGR02145 family)
LKTKYKQMKTSCFFNHILLIGLVLVVLFGCKKENPKVVPTVTTAAATAITSTTLTCGGEVKSDGGVALTAIGVCWSVNQNPTVSDTKTADGIVSGAFISAVNGLNPGTSYYIRAYATNAIGAGYGNQVIARTEALLPSLTTASLTAITATTATTGGTVSSDGGSAVTDRGVCWGIGQYPTTANFKTSDGTGTGTFNSNLAGLTPGTAYYVRAYATNFLGTAYGNQLTLTSLALLPSLTTTAVSLIQANSATSGGTINNDGGAAVISRGVCWSTSQSPTIFGSKSFDGTGTGYYVSNLTALSPNTTYFARAYATNSQGTAYGNEITFKTGLLFALATLATAEPSNVTSNSTLLGGNISDDGNAAVTERGVVYATQPNPTTGNSKVVMGNGTGAFSSVISGLQSGTTYYARTYAINNQGTAYGENVSFTTSGIIFNSLLSYGNMNDIDGNSYKTIAIGTQVWMAENLKTTKYKDGTAIAYVTTTWENLTSGAYNWSNNDIPSFKATYGAYYNWFAVNTGKLCPTGWHVPTDEEWNVLIGFLGGESIAGAALKETSITHWIYPNTGATNASGFTALPAGNYGKYGYFSGTTGSGYWYSATQFDGSNANFYSLYFDDGKVTTWHCPKYNGNTVRCIGN